MNVAGLTSGRGQTLSRIVDQLPDGVTVPVIIAADDDAPALAAATARDIPTAVVGPPDAGDGHQRRLLAALADHDIDLLCLDGYGRSLPRSVHDRVSTVLDSHDSLLPAFPGPDPVGDTLDAGVPVTGCTVYVRTEGTDCPDGRAAVTQEPTAVRGDDTVETLAARLRRECTPRAYTRALELFVAGRVTVDGETAHVAGEAGGRFPEHRLGSHDRTRQLRYGENPHQAAALYADPTDGPRVVGADQLNPGAKAMSYNNYNDADAALATVREFATPAAVVIKHTTPAGCATADSLVTAYERALSTDPMSAFGGIVGLNRECDAATAEAVVDSFKEVVVAPGYTDEALAVLRAEERLRVLDVGPFPSGDTGGDEPPLTETAIAGGQLVQERDTQRLGRGDLTVVTERDPTDDQVETMLFAWQTLKHVKSNGVLLATGTETVGVGMGQVSRVDAVRLAVLKADEHAEGKDAEGAVLASDAFFPFPDGVERAAAAGVDAVVQPGGSKNDDAVIAAADDLGLAMAVTGQRCFRHD